MILLNDFTTSVEKALEEIDVMWDSYPGLIVCGTHAPKDIEETLKKIEEARKMGLPTLGICMGLDLMLIEYARNVLGLSNANSTEIDPETAEPIFTKLPELRVGIKDVNGRQESHWHNYAFNNKYKDLFAQHWEMTFTGDILETAKKGSQTAVQFHPEYNSSIDNPHPLLVNFIDICKK